MQYIFKYFTEDRVANMQLQSITKNNQGVDFMISRDFEKAICSFQESLKCAKSELLFKEEEQQQSDFFNEEHQSIHRFIYAANLFQMNKMQNSTTLDHHGTSQAEALSGLTALLSPFRLLPMYTSSGTLSIMQQETTTNLLIAIMILNIAISYHHLVLMGNIATTARSSERKHDMEATNRTRAKSLYHVVVQIARDASSLDDPDTKHLEAMFDIVLVISLNNLLVLELNDDESSHDTWIQSVPQLVHVIEKCSSKEYCGAIGISVILSKCLKESLFNVLVLRTLQPKSAAAA